MSLTGWIKENPDLFDNLIKLTACSFPSGRMIPQMIPRPPVAAPRTANYAGVGRAFDYAFRMRIVQLNRLAPEALSSCGLLSQARSGSRGEKKRASFLSSFWSRWKVACAGSSVDDLLEECLILGNLEGVFRSGYDPGDESIFHVSSGDVDDLKRLVSLIDPSVWRGGRFVLNPSFGGSSVDVGGADADLIHDGLLIDIKTTKYLSMRVEYIRQLMGYFVLSLREGNPHGVHSLGIYFSRHGVLASFPVTLGGECLVDPLGRHIPSGWDGVPGIWDTIEDGLDRYNDFLESDVESGEW